MCAKLLIFSYICKKRLIFFLMPKTMNFAVLSLIFVAFHHKLLWYFIISFCGISSSAFVVNHLMFFVTFAFFVVEKRCFAVGNLFNILSV